MMTIALTLSEAITRCNQELGLSANTERSYRNALKKFTEFLNLPTDTSTSQLDIDHFIHFIFWLLSQKLSKASMMMYKSGISNFLEWLILKHYIEITMEEKSRFKESCKRLARKHEEHLPEIPNDEDVEKIINFAKSSVENSKSVGLYAFLPYRDLAIVILFCRSGLRVGELCGLKVSDIDMDGRRIRVRGKGDKDEYVRFDDEARDTIQKYWSVRGYAGEDDPAFARHDKKSSGLHEPITTAGVRQIMKKLQVQTGVKRIHPHAFRHYFGVTVLRESGNLALTQDMMRHSSPTVTRLYAKITNNERDTAYDEIFDK